MNDIVEMTEKQDLMPMTTVDAIKHVVEYFELTSIYAVAKSLSDEKVKVQPIQIRKYLDGISKMSPKVAKQFATVYGIEITDVYKSGTFEK